MSNVPDQPAARVSLDDVRKAARLSRLAISDADAERFRGELAAVLGHFSSLQQLDLADVEPMTTPTRIVNRLAEDAPGPTLPTDVLMSMAPRSMPPYVKVPKVLGGNDTHGSGTGA